MTDRREPDQLTEYSTALGANFIAGGCTVRAAGLPRDGPSRDLQIRCTYSCTSLRGVGDGAISATCAAGVCVSVCVFMGGAGAAHRR